MEKDDEILGNGNLYSAEYWEYDPRLIRRWNLDPVVKPWESGYASFENNPISYSDPQGLDVINGHKAEKDKAESKLCDAQEKFDGLNKGDAGYRAAKKELRQAKSEFKFESAKYQRVENKINEIKQKDPDLFNSADKLTDAGGTKVDVYVYDTPTDIMQIGVPEDQIKYGDTDAKYGALVSSADGSVPDYYAVRSNRNGDNTVTIRVSDIAKATHLAHEFGHGIYQVKNMKQYVDWLIANPREQNKSGHGIGDPSGKAAEDAEKKFKK